jgi:hypothetical protein
MVSVVTSMLHSFPEDHFSCWTDAKVGICKYNKVSKVEQGRSNVKQ